MTTANNWNDEKNEELKQRYGVGFEDVLVALQEGRLLAEIAHPNPGKYPNQRVYVVEIDDYAYSVPFVTDGENKFFKTLYPSRKYQKRFVNSDDDD